MQQIDLFAEISRLRQKGEGVVLVSVVSRVGSAPASDRGRMVVRQDGSILGTVGGGLAEARIMEEAQAALGDGQPRLYTVDLKPDESASGPICGGKFDVFIDPILAPPRLFIFGGGHVTAALAPLAQRVGFRVVITDNREEFADPDRFPSGVQTFCSEYEKSVDSLGITEQDYVALITQGHATDTVLLPQVLRTPAAYVGMIGSKTKAKIVLDRMKDQGFSDDELARVRSPMGVPIGSQTPDEVAVSIAAELVKLRRQSEARP